MYPSSAIFFTLFPSVAADVLTSEQRAALHRASALSSLEQLAFGNVSVREIDEQLEEVPVETTHLSVLRSQSSPTPHSMASDPLSQSVPTGKDIADIHAPFPANSMQIKFAAHVLSQWWSRRSMTRGAGQARGCTCSLSRQRKCPRRKQNPVCNHCLWCTLSSRPRCSCAREVPPG
jgi:hypothetical protein